MNYYFKIHQEEDNFWVEGFESQQEAAGQEVADKISVEKEPLSLDIRLEELTNKHRFDIQAAHSILPAHLNP